ncbi:dynamin family protein [Ruania albidiflava]|uniref:dynamin family protein n=1 Tax=Ruania albidiflava TaxID=366586 RepID=UPI0003B74FAE|nr:dynamin family protein [Ruania albidiflava]
MDAALSSLREAVQGAVLPLQLPGATAARHSRQHLLDQLDDYLLPRATSLGAPLLAVVGGSTGAGKSTLVNALVGDVLSRTGAIRPTTRDPLLVHHPRDEHHFTEPRILPHLPRLRSTLSRQDPQPVQQRAQTGSQVLRLAVSDAVGPGLALLDAPDIDSVVDANRQLAGQLLAAADLWLFVTTAHRYADAVPWDLLTAAAARDVLVAVVLDRIPPAVVREVSDDLAGMLADHGLAGAPLFLVTERELDVRGMLPPGAVADLHTWLTQLTQDAAARAAVARRTLLGAVRSATAAARSLAAAVDEQAAAAEEMDQQLARIFDVTELLTRVTDGALLRGEVLSRWQDFVGTGELFRSVESTVGRLRDRATAFLTGKPRPARRVEHALEQGLHSVLVEQADQAAHRAYTQLWQQPAGRELLPGPELERAADTFSADAAAAIRQWQRYVLELVRTEGQDKRTTARVLAFGVNGLAVVLMVLAFASTGGLVGAEVAIAGGTAVVAQKLLEAIFGDQAVRRLAARARADLSDRVTVLFATERDRFGTLLPDAVGTRAAADRLRSTTAALDHAAADLEQPPEGP